MADREYLSKESHTLRGAIDRKALLTMRDICNQEESLAITGEWHITGSHSDTSTPTKIRHNPRPNLNFALWPSNAFDQ